MTPGNDNTVLDIQNLSVSFFTPVGEVKAVDNVSYTLKYGEVMGIVGESGSGKSVEAYSILGILDAPGKITGGKILFKGRDILTLGEQEKRALRGGEISMIFQNPMTSLNPVWTIGNQLESVLREHDSSITKDEARRRVTGILKDAGINNPEKRMRQYPHELSGGMRQRVMIAMALICDPALLIADEPTTALDVTIQAQILDLMKSIKKRTRMGIVFITHNLAVVAEICDNVSVMYGGRIVEQGPVEAIFYNAAHPYTQGLLRSMPRVDETRAERLIPIEGTPINMLEPKAGCPFAPRCEYCMKVCINRRPEYSEIESGHRAACWRLFKQTEESQRTTKRTNNGEL
jgi:oligopeptide transport system ATP-binding protein